MTSIIILNWNGNDDTIKCLISLSKINNEFFIILIDNGSKTENRIKLHQDIDKLNGFNDITTIVDINYLPHVINSRDIIIYENIDNQGFAKGNNIGIKIAKKFNPEYILLLNNDTEVDPNFLTKLITFNKINPDYLILTPLICYYKNKNIIWNAGGQIKFGLRKYFYADKTLNEIKEKQCIKISFVTGCALFFKTNILSKLNYIFTEKFFFGEEDFEFSLRIKKIKIKMACVLESIIFHKVGNSTSNLNSIGKIYVHYLNRYINLRQNQSIIKHLLWRIIYNPYIFFLLIRNKIKLKKIFKFLYKLNFESYKFDNVDKNKFETHIKNGID